MLERIADWSGWAMIALMAVIIVDLISRKAGCQVRYFTSTRLHARGRAWIELTGCLLFAFPFAYVCIHYALPFLLTSYSVGGMSDALNGLPFRWVINVAGMLLIPLAAVQHACGHHPSPVGRNPKAVREDLARS